MSMPWGTGGAGPCTDGLAARGGAVRGDGAPAGDGATLQSHPRSINPIGPASPPLFLESHESAQMYVVLPTATPPMKHRTIRNGSNSGRPMQIARTSGGLDRAPTVNPEAARPAPCRDQSPAHAQPQ